MSWTTFNLETSDHVAHLKFNRPEKLNSFVPALWSELPQAVNQLEQEGDARVIVISSTGKHFTAGMDLSVFASFDKDNKAEPARQNAAFMELVKTLQQTFTCLAETRMPVIAAIQGGCIGAGLDLVTACDLRYASKDAYFLLAEVNLAMMADVGTFPRLQKLIPVGIAREMAFTGEPLPADRAERIGLVNDVFGNHNELVKGAMSVATKIAGKSPLAIWGSKLALNHGADHTTADTLEYVANWQAGMFSPGDVKAALFAQQNKEKPVFEGLSGKKVLK